MTNEQAKTALITGASGGLGLELCHCFAQDGINLVMVARDDIELNNVAKRIEKKHGINITIIACDLTKPNAVDTVFNQVNAQGIHIDYLVNNAGIGLHDAFAQSNSEDDQRMLQLNVAVLTELSQRFMPAMLQRNDGRILNVASLVAYQPGGAQAALYYASKNFVLSFSRGLANELRDSDVSVTALCPGPMHTNFQAHNNFSHTRLYRLFNNNLHKTARAGYKAMQKGKMTIVPGLINKLLAFSGELPPRRIALEINRWLLVTSNKAPVPVKVHNREVEQ